MKIIFFRGELTDNSAKKEALIDTHHVEHSPECAASALCRVRLEKVAREKEDHNDNAPHV